MLASKYSNSTSSLETVKLHLEYEANINANSTISSKSKNRLLKKLLQINTN
jgi:cell fate (sporulation/competence/biofilm development) regulator YmcA (YheA/YmcA/DUF963 family)